MYVIGRTVRADRPSWRRRLIILIILCLSLAVAAVLIGRWLQADNEIGRPAARTSRLQYSNLKRYAFKDFTIDLPVSWTGTSKPPAGSDYAWQAAGGQTLDIQEDNLPANFPVSRVVIVAGQGDRLQLMSQASPDCKSFTPSRSPTAGQLGVATSWRGLSFFCDQRQQAHTVLGSGSVGGATNSVSLHTKAGKPHRFFFMLVDYGGQPDYQPFYDALKTFRMR